MIPLIVCTIGSKSLPVLKASVDAYAPKCRLWIFQGYFGNFGEDYNMAMSTAFASGFDEILIANDDIVLDPSTISTLLDNVVQIKEQVDKPGLISVRSNYVRQVQNSAFNQGLDIIKADAVSPILAWVSKEAFTAAQFPPLNWYSDDVLCEDLNKLGYSHYISTSYVHHVGSNTIGKNSIKHVKEAMPWIKEHRPDYYNKWFGA